MVMAADLGDFPIKLARPEDGPEMLELLRLWHGENGLSPWNEGKVVQTLERGLNQNWAVIGVIRGKSMIEASIGLYVGSFYYTEQEHVEDLWNFVRPEFRRTTHAKKLLRFAREAADMLDRPLLAGVLSTEQTAAKVRLYEREFGPPSGAMFVVNGRLPAPVAA